MSIRPRLDEIKDAMASSPCNWVAACTAWQDVSAEAKGTTLELVVDWLGYCLQLRDLEAVRSGLRAIEEALGDEPVESARPARGGLSQ